MNAEALIGTVLGSCTLQKLVGQGGMGAVYLAQQSRPRRQVAVKVLLPMAPLSSHQLAAFLERFRRETDAAAALEHPHIMPVYEYGENNGLAYLVMPYISSGTLRDELELEGPLPLPKVVNYLEQLAAALDFAHEHGVIHRDIKPANMMVTPDGRLLLTDFGLVKIVDDGRIPQSHVRLTGAGAPVGTPDYMSPEQVIGEDIDTRADLYSLGVILFQMVTGTTPFQGETPMQIAAQHLQIPPPSPQMLRPDLPIAAEQVILRSLAKRPADRYMYAAELARAFRTAIMEAGIALEPSYIRSAMLTTASRLPTPASLGITNTTNEQKNQFVPKGQTIKLPGVAQPAGRTLTKTGTAQTVTQSSLAVPAVGGGLLSRTGKFPMVGTGTGTGVMPVAPTGGGLLSRTGKFPMVGTGTGIMPTLTPATTINGREQLPTSASSVLESSPVRTPEATGALGTQEHTNAIKLSGPVKVVKVPVAGQPGKYVTGFLPITPTADRKTPTKGQPLEMKIAMVVLVILLVAGAIGAYWLTHHSAGQTTNPATSQKPLSAAAATATSIARATTTAIAYNQLLSDPLDSNLHGWPVTPASAFAFKDGAYHVTDDQDKGRATIIEENSLPATMRYTLTMEEINGDDTSAANSFGMIFRCSQHARKGGGDPVTTFYSFEVVNTKGGEYQFWKYDDTNQDNPWSLIQDGKLTFGKEYHQGKGDQNSNTFSIFMDGGTFTLTVNGTALTKTFHDDTFKSGVVGMIVNKKGTEVAFKNLLLTRK